MIGLRAVRSEKMIIHFRSIFGLQQLSKLGLTCQTMAMPALDVTELLHYMVDDLAKQKQREEHFSSMICKFACARLTPPYIKGWQNMSHLGHRMYTPTLFVHANCLFLGIPADCWFIKDCEDHLAAFDISFRTDIDVCLSFRSRRKHYFKVTRRTVQALKKYIP